MMHDLNEEIIVSVVVPIYNMEKYLDRCLATLLNQTEKKYEIILVDDGSVDQSSLICDQYESKYPNKVRTIHKTNGGLSSARNVGILNAKGKYIIFPDPDDWVEYDYIEIAVNYQSKYNADLVALGYFVEYDDKSIPANNDQLILMNKKEAETSLLVKPSMYGFAWNKLYRLDIIRQNDLYFLDDVGTTEDLDFAFRYLEYCNKVCFAPGKRVYHYYQRTGAATFENFSKRKVDNIRTYEKIIKHSKDNPKLLKAAKDEICNTAINLCWLYKKDCVNDKESWNTIQENLNKYLIEYLMSNNYSIGRKVQAILAKFAPNLYNRLKNKLH